MDQNRQQGTGLSWIATIVVVKEFLVSDVRRRLGTTVIVFVAAGTSACIVYYLLNLPVFVLIQKLK